MTQKEAMKILKDFHDKSALFSVRIALDTIIPELKESEDEKIRKRLIQHLQELRKSHVNLMTKDTYDSWISWLEKQGEQKPKEMYN